MCIFLLCLSKSTDVLTIFVASVRLSAGDSILDLMKSIIGMFLFVKYRFEISSRPRSPVKTRCPVCYITLCCCSLSRYNIFILAAHLSDIVTARSWMHFRPDYSVTYANVLSISQYRGLNNHKRDYNSVEWRHVTAFHEIICHWCWPPSDAILTKI